jgi:mannosyltransferase OCH1-like enzyme
MIPKRLVRTVPEVTDIQQEVSWDRATRLHPDWEHITLRDPIDKTDFPLTHPQWGACESGAQLADLVRAEELYLRGGVYIDSDVDVFKPFDPLLSNQGVLAWEDPDHICNAVMAFEPNHFGLAVYIETALKRLPQGTWASGIGTVTEVFKDRSDVLLLPPGSFFPVHYNHKIMLGSFHPDPWSFCVHTWRHSWKQQ